MCYGALVHVKCKRCLGLGLGIIEEINFEHCDIPCSLPYTIVELDADDVPARDECEVCTPTSGESDEDGYKKVAIWRRGRLNHGNTQSGDWSEQIEHFVTREYCATQGGISMTLINPIEQATTVQEQLDALFQELENGFTWGGRPSLDFGCEKSDNWELVMLEIHWPREGTCVEVEECWMLVEAGVMSRA